MNIVLPKTLNEKIKSNTDGSLEELPKEITKPEIYMPQVLKESVRSVPDGQEGTRDDSEKKRVATKKTSQNSSVISLKRVQEMAEKTS